MLPDYIIYDELKKERERDQERERPRLEIPKYRPPAPDSEFDEEQDNEEEVDRGVTIIQM